MPDKSTFQIVLGNHGRLKVENVGYQAMGREWTEFHFQNFENLCPESKRKGDVTQQ